MHFLAMYFLQGDNLEEEMGVGGATADDLDQEMIKNVLETEIVGKWKTQNMSVSILKLVYKDRASFKTIESKKK